GFEALQAEARQALDEAASRLGALGSRWHEASTQASEQWQRITEELDSIAGAVGADDELRRVQLELSAAIAAAELDRQRTRIAVIELAVKVLQSTGRFLDGGDEAAADPASERLPQARAEMRILEAQESERARLAQEIHDGPAQALSNIVFRLELIDRMLESDGPGARQELHRLREVLQREMEEVRTFIHDLQSPLLGELGLNGAIRDSVEKGGVSNGPLVDLDLRAPEDALNEAQQTVVLRVAQEALRNVRKHAGASHAWVSTWLEGTGASGSWVLEIRDDGTGFPAEDAMAQSGRGHFGLRFMRERAELVGGTLTIDSGPSAGTKVRLSISRMDRS
ncbi:MAG: sensor histidine kinase, partial [Chloroflexota bacterium]|nr:sensor histidine kinase [Chloroflexota bacterium]